MVKDQPFPALWLLSDARNDAVLEDALERLPRGSGFVFRHYHLAPENRFARYRALLRLARNRQHLVILSDSVQTAREWRADGAYGSPNSLLPAADMLRIATAHDLREIGQANRVRADAVMLSPAYPTRSHSSAPSLGPTRFRTLAAHAQMPVIALGGMTQERADRLGWPYWAAIDGLS